MMVAALLLNGCADGGRALQNTEEKDSVAVEMDSGAKSVNESDELSESAEKKITPAATRQGALDLYDKAFSQHDFAYLRAACIEPYGQENVDFLLANGLMSEEEYWGAYDDSQGSYYKIGVFESYSSEITDEKQIEETKTIEEELFQTYGYSCIVQEAYEVTYKQIAAGTEGTAVNEGYRAQVVRVDDSWYILKML